VANDTFEFRETKYFKGRRELASEMFGARQWWSFFKGLGSWPSCELGLKLLLCV
jgi:hypothetical protein